MSEITTDLTCGNCHRSVTAVNLHVELGTCLFCDCNREGRADV